MPILFAVSPLAAIRSAPVNTAVDLAGRHERRGRAVHDHRERDTERLELPCGETRALEKRPRLVDPDVLDAPLLPRRTHRAERRSVATRGEAARVAVREHARSGRHERGWRARAIRRQRSTSSSWSARARSRRRIARASRRAPSGDSQPSGEPTRASRTASSRSSPRGRRQREPVRRRDADRGSAPDRQCAGWRRRPRPPTRTSARPPRPAAAAGRAGRPRLPRAGRCAQGSDTTGRPRC